MLTQSKSELKKETINKWSSTMIDRSIEWDHKSNDIDIPMFPIAKKISSQTIGMNLVTVSPIGNSIGVTNKILDEIKSINRDRKIESIIEDKEFKEMKIEDHLEYRGPSSKIFYLDYKYGSTCSIK